MNEFLTNILWLDGFLVAGLGIGFLLGRYGISGIWTDITNIKTDITNLKLQAPITVSAPVKVTPVVPSTKTITHGTTATSAVLPNPIGQAPAMAPVVVAV